MGMGKLLPHRSFNTQPPEGGWTLSLYIAIALSGFNTQPPEGGWRKIAPYRFELGRFNTQPPEGGWNFMIFSFTKCLVSTHSRPKAAG